MASNKSIKKILKSILLVVVMLLLLFGGVALLKSCSSENPGTVTDQFSVTYGETTYTADSDIITLTAGTNTFKVNNGGNYSIKVTAGTYDFEFTANDKKYKFSETGDLTSAFNLSLKAQYFVLNDGSYSYLSVLNTVYGSVEITDSTAGLPNYKIIVTSGTSDQIVLNIEYCSDISVQLDWGGFVF